MCYDEYYCSGGGGGDGGGGGWGPNPDPHGGGSGGTTNPQTNPYWWQGGEEDCRCPPPVRDSTFYKNYLAKTSDSIRTEAQNAYNTAQHNMEEWYFVMGGKDSSIKVRSKDTDHKQHYCRIKYIVFAGEKLIGEYHTHYNDEPPAYPPGRSCSIDAKDILALKPHTSVQDYVSFCDLGNEYQVYVIEDPVKATAFLKTLQPDFGERWEDSAYRYSLFSNYRERTLNFTKQFLGSSAITGIGLYKTIDIDKKNFIKLN